MALSGLRRWAESSESCKEAIRLCSAEGGTAAALGQLEGLRDKCTEELRKAAEKAQQEAANGPVPKKKTYDRPALWDRPAYETASSVPQKPRSVEYVRGATVRDVSDTPDDAPACAAGDAAGRADMDGGGVSDAPAAAGRTSAPLAAAPQSTPAHTPPPPPTEAERKKAAEVAAAAAAEIASQEARRKERARAEGEAQKAKDRAHRQALDEALRERNAELRAELAQRRHQQREEALAKDAKMVATRAEVAARLAGEVLRADDDKDAGGSGGGGRRSASAAAAAVAARASVDAWRIKQSMPTRAPLTEPRTPSEFVKQYALLQKDSPSLVAYLRLIPPERCKAVFSPEVPPDVLMTMAHALTKHLTALGDGGGSPPEGAADREQDQALDGDAGSWCAAWLHGLSKAGRFDMTVLMLDRAAKTALSSLFDALATRGVAGETLKPLRKAYIG